MEEDSVRNGVPVLERTVSLLDLLERYPAGATIRNLTRELDLPRSTVYRKIAEGTFPSQVKISVHGAGWRESAINLWIADPVGYREEITDQVAQTQKVE